MEIYESFGFNKLDYYHSENLMLWVSILLVLPTKVVLTMHHHVQSSVLLNNI